MTRDQKRNVAASVRQRLMNKSREQKEAFDLVLIRFALERLLYRLSQSSHGRRFVLKGAMLFQIWSGLTHRPTRDLDLLGTGTPSPERFEQLFRDVCEQEVEDDGLVFQAETVRAELMKEEEQYEGLRLKLQARLASARIAIQIDIGFGDAITPGPDAITYPTVLDFPPPAIQAYPRETVIAEKYQAMVMLGIANSRMKDFFDLWNLSQTFEFSGATLTAAIKATFDRRETEIPQQMPFAFTANFTEDVQKVAQWKAFVNKARLPTNGITLTQLAAALSEFLIPPTVAAADGQGFADIWQRGGPWTPPA